MSRVVGLSGAQGGGKSSLLNEMQARGYQVDDFRVSRAVQRRLGWDTLDRVLDTPYIMQEFQTEILKQKCKNDYELAHDGKSGVILVERTFADIVAYAQVWSWKFVDRGDLNLHEAMKWMADFTRAAQKAHTDCYSGTMLLPLMSHVVFEHDPHRAKREDAELVYEEIECFCRHKLPINFKTMTISAKSTEDRAHQVEAFLRSL